MKPGWPRTLLIWFGVATTWPAVFVGPIAGIGAVVVYALGGDPSAWWMTFAECVVAWWIGNAVLKFAITSA